MVDSLPARCKHARGLLAQNVVHQIKVVAAFFNQRAAGVGAKTVPVGHFGVERFAVLTDSHLVHGAHSARVRHANHLGHRRHIAVFLRNPYYFCTATRFLYQVPAVVHGGAQWFFNQDVHIRWQCQTHQLRVGKVGRGNHHCVAQATA